MFNYFSNLMRGYNDLFGFPSHTTMGFDSIESIFLLSFFMLIVSIGTILSMKFIRFIWKL